MDSAAVYNMKIPYSRDELSVAIGEVMRANGLAGDSYIRLFCWYGLSDLTLGSFRWPVHTGIIAAPFGRLFSDELSRQGLRVAISPWKKIHHSMLPSKAKACGQYLGSVLASRYAVENGCHEALLVGSDGNLSEGPAENIFLVKDGHLLTNDDRSSILLGITRDSVITIARDLSIPVAIRPLTLEDLQSASEAFFTGTAVEIVRICQVDTKVFAAWSPASITESVQTAFRRIVTGLDDRYWHWLQIAASTVGAASQTEIHALAVTGGNGALPHG
jgi:branched-chain amino acid aminotransferase